MYHMLIVDDCPTEIECILFLIRRYDLPLEALTAANGQEAYALLSRQPFDILFTDIKMPLMDGVSLAGKAKELYPDIRVILFSGYNDFIDAKNAISIGVTEYLMKPVDPDAFHRTLRAVLGAIEASRARDREALLVRRHMLYLPLTRDAKTPPPAQERSFVDDYCLMLLLEFEADFFSREGEDFESGLNDLFSCPCDFISLYPEQGLILMRRAGAPAEAPEALAGRVMRYVASRYGKECFAACEPVGSAEDFLPAYRRLESRTERGLAPSARAQGLPDGVELPMAQMTEALRQGDLQLFRDGFGAFLAGCADTRAPSSLYTKFCVAQLIAQLRPFRGNAPRESEIVESVFACDSVGELEALVMRALQAAEENLEILSNQKTEAIKRYIYQHYSEDLGLEELASAFYFSPNYLCRLFKRETGCTPGKFLHDYRMKKAQELLEGSQMKVAHVSQAVGFKSASYFCQRFRDRFGVSPEIYRQNALRRQNAQPHEEE